MMPNGRSTKHGTRGVGGGRAAGVSSDIVSQRTDFRTQGSLPCKDLSISTRRHVSESDSSPEETGFLYRRFGDNNCLSKIEWRMLIVLSDESRADRPQLEGGRQI